MNERRALILEGGDGVGKNFLARAVVENLLANEEQVIFANFPMYWFTGKTIRMMNRVGEIKTFLSALDGFREASIRAALYALDRAFGLSFILQIKEQHPDTIIISDRGPLSNAVTAGYAWSQSRLNDGNIDQFITEVIQHVDQEFMEALQPSSLLCRNTHLENGGSLHREGLDIYEQPQPQEYATRVYSMLNLPHIFTRFENRTWKSPSELAKEALLHIGYTSIEESPTVDFIQAQKNSQLLLVGPQLLAPISDKDSLSTRINLWIHLSTLPDRQLYEMSILKEGGIDRKVALDRLESELSQELRWRVAVGNSLLLLHPLATQAIQRLVNEYPELLHILTLTEQQSVGEFPWFIRRIASGEI